LYFELRGDYTDAHPNQIKEGMMATAKKTQRTAEDPVKVDPRHYKVEFENDRVRVLRIKYNPGEKSVMHSHPESIGVFLTDAHAKFTYPDGRNEDINAKAGSVQHMDAFTHLPENLGKTPFEVIAVELKR
jgi:quercetin dioxygenase-like cupin family protein